MKILAGAGADVNQPVRRGEYGSLPAAAASQSDRKIVELLLEVGSNVNATLNMENIAVQ